MADLYCRICQAADGDAVPSVSFYELDVHEREHNPTTARYNRVTGLVERGLPNPPGNRWVEREAYSTGRAIVECECGDPACLCDDPDCKPTITDEAYGLVMGARQSDYNHPQDDFKATGRQWAAVLTNWLHSEGYTLTVDGTGIDVDVPDVPPRIVALMMAQLKISRESHKPKHDNRVDAIGYLVCADRIVEGY